MSKNDRFDQLSKSLPKEVLNTTVYSLCGQDVLCVLADNGKLETMSDKEVIEAIEYVAEELEIPWMEYIEVQLELLNLMESNK